MKRHLSILVSLFIIAAMMICSLAACGEEETPVTPAPSEGTVTPDEDNGDTSVDPTDPTDPTDPVATNVLTGDTQTVNATVAGAEYTYTAKLDGTYVISWSAESAVVKVTAADGTVTEITSGYEFTLASGDTVTFVMATASEDGSYDVILSIKEDDAADVNVLAGDTQTVNATYAGVDYAFTAKLDGTYVITWTSDNAVIVVETENGSEEIVSGYEFTLASGESFVFYMCTDGDEDDSYEVNVSVKGDEVNVLTGGEQTVNATYFGNAYTFTAKLDGTYVITWTSDNAVIVVVTENGSDEITSGYEFDLASGESVVIIMCTAGDEDDTYDVNVSVKGDEIPTENVLTGGEQTVNATATGTVYTFTAKLNGTYVITFDGDVAFITVEYGNISDAGIESGYEFTLASGESVTIIMMPADWDAETAEYTVSIDPKEEASEENVLTGGEQTVNATATGNPYTYTAKLDGTYVITFDEDVAFITVEYGNISDAGIESGYEFTLASGETITFIMMPYDMEAESAEYAVKIDIKA